MTTNAINRTRFGADFIKRISDEAFESAAVNHPYLQALRQGAFPNVHLALQDFAVQYGIYSNQFICCLSAVIENLHAAEHKKILQSNLSEENGGGHDIELPPDLLESAAGQSHTQLFQRFQESLGINATHRAAASDCQAGLRWSQQFLQICKMNECVGIGAIGIGTELIVANIYNQILDGLKAHSGLTMSQRVFFELHSECDDEHAAQMILIAENLAQNLKACEQIEYGVHMAVKFRTAFWDEMLKRAQNFPASIATANERLSAVGYQTSL